MVADALALIGFISLITGVYLWLGLPAALIVLGIGLIYTAVQIERTGESHEPGTTSDTNPQP